MSQTMSRCLCAVFISGFFHVLQLVYYKVLRNHMNSAWFSASKRVFIRFISFHQFPSLSLRKIRFCQGAASVPAVLAVCHSHRPGTPETVGPSA